VDYFDEEKFEGGRRKKKLLKSDKAAEGEGQAAGTTSPAEKETAEEESNLVSGKEADTTSGAEAGTSPEGNASKRKGPAAVDPSSSQKKSKNEASSAPLKKVKTKSGTFSVTDVS